MSDIQKLYIDLDLKENLLVTVNCKQLDNLKLILNIWDNGIQADLSNYRCRLKALKQDQVPLIQNTDITINNNEVNIASDEQLTTTSGIVKSELQFIDKTTGEKKSTFNLNIKVIPSVLEIDRTISVATITLLQELDNKLDEIEDIGDVLNEAKTVKSGLESDITNVKNIKENLDSSINTANTTKTSLDTSNTNANNAKMALDASSGSANNIKGSLETTITNAENKKQEIVTECALADQKILAMQGFGDITAITQDVSNLKIEIQNARNGEANLDARLDKVDTSLSEKANPNLLINGDFQVWQRGTSFPGVIAQYTADRWKVETTNGSYPASVLKVDNGIQITTGGAGVGAVLKYTFEDSDFKKLNGKTATMSYSKNGVVVNSTFIINSAIIQVVGIGNNMSSETSIINWAKLELGSIATPFVPRLYAEELALCQRYYETIPYFISPSVQGSGTTANIISVHPYKVTKRISPTIVFKDNSGASGYCTRGIIGTSVNNTQPISANVISTSDMLIAESPSGLSATYIGFSATADSEIY